MVASRFASAIVATVAACLAAPRGGLRLQLADERPLQAWPRVIAKGQTATLSWFNPRGSEVLIEQAPDDRRRRPLLLPVGHFPAKGSIQVAPATTTMYVISCGEVRCAESITVTVRDLR